MASMTQCPPSGNASLVGLEHEIRNTPTDELAEMITLLIELPPCVEVAAQPRLRMAAWELWRRVGEMEQAA